MAPVQSALPPTPEPILLGLHPSRVWALGNPYSIAPVSSPRWISERLEPSSAPAWSVTTFRGIWKYHHQRCAMARGASGEVSEAAVHLESLLDK